MAKNFCSGSSWIPATIVSKLEPLSYLIETDNSKVMRRHVDHLKSRFRVNESESQSPTIPYSIEEDTPDSGEARIEPTRSDSSQPVVTVEETTESP